MISGPRIYNLFPLLAGPIPRWHEFLQPIAAMGFNWIFVNPFHQTGFSGSLYAIKDYYALHPLLKDEADTPLEILLSRFTQAAKENGLRVMMDLVINHTAKDSPLVEDHPLWYRRDFSGALLSPKIADPDDPSLITEWGDLAELDYGNPRSAAEMTAYWRDLALFYADLGFDGFRCDAAYKIPAAVWQSLIHQVKAKYPQALFAAESLGCTLQDVQNLHEAGFDFLFNSAKWWDFRASWLLEQYETFRSIAPSIAFPESHDTERLIANVPKGADNLAYYKLWAAFTACFSAGWMMPMGYEYGLGKSLHVVATRPEDWQENKRFDLRSFIAALNGVKASMPVLNREGAQHLLQAPKPVVALWREGGQDQGEGSVLIVINPDQESAHTLDLERLLAQTTTSLPQLQEITPQAPVGEIADSILTLEPLEIRLFGIGGLYRHRQIQPAVQSIVADESLLAHSLAGGIIIENIQPSVDGGAYPVKSELGEAVTISADILRHGHDVIGARLIWRRQNDESWRSAPLSHCGNDRWQGSFTPDNLGLYEFTIEAWHDPYATWQHALEIKKQAGQDIDLDILEGQAIDRHIRPMRHPHIIKLMVEPSLARFAAWYEMMPRSQGNDPHKSATFKDCIARLPDINAMGFDVVYLTPIHPIGRMHRKGPNNSLFAGPDDPGSPYAIGSADGGHRDIHPDLGTLADFHALVQACADWGMKVALDLAIQCAPDHPWISQHPEWFVFRPDGTIKYAENPPKKYQDIVNVNFDSPHAQDLWRAILEIVLFWVEQGIDIFRVDNPHTKPISFWHWLIGEVKARHPQVMFLSEAFTRPKIMKLLAKVGFSQSYTYFTWRNDKAGLTDYLTELSQGEERHYLRPHFFPTTPDILPFYLQEGGRAAFLIRLILASTLSSLYGMYNSYELCEGRGLIGKEEYLDSEKYQYRVWDWDRAGHIKAEITRLNAIRRANPALWHTKNLRFYPSSDPSVLFYGKMTSDRSNMIFIAVSLDPFDVRSTDLVFPLSEMGLSEDDDFLVEELLWGSKHLWRSACQTISLNPAENPAQIYRVTRVRPAAYQEVCF